MSIELWNANDLYDILTDDRLDPIPSYFLDNFFGETYFSDDREIIFSKIPGMDRKMAPFVLPSSQGKPIFEARGETVSRFMPAYIKLKDAVRPADMTTRRPSEVLSGRKLTLQERFDARTVEIANAHRRAIQMRMSHMAARAVIDGQVVVNYEADQGAAYPEVTLTFGRASNHTVTLSGSYWSDSSYDILNDIQTWSDRMRDAEFGGTPTVMLVGSSVAPVFRTNTKLKEEMNTQYRGNDVQIRTGLIQTPGVNQPITYMGTLGAGLEVYAYKDTVQNANGSSVDLMSPKDIVLMAPGYRGIRAYGAIYDAEAMMEGNAAIDIYPKMWATKDPGEIYIMNQSSPLLIPLYPNRSLKATVLA